MFDIGKVEPSHGKVIVTRATESWFNVVKFNPKDVDRIAVGDLVFAPVFNLYLTAMDEQKKYFVVDLCVVEAIQKNTLP